MKQSDIANGLAATTPMALSLSRLGLAEIVDVLDGARVLLRDLVTQDISLCPCPESFNPSVSRLAVVLRLDIEPGTTLASVVGLLQDGVWPSKSMPASELVLTAKDRLVLKCGDATLSMEADGTVRLKGRRISSRASEKNLVAGGSVHLN
jgi:hypothetical protein